MSSNHEVLDELQMARLFRGFELTMEYREILYSGESLFSHLPKLIKGAIEYQFLPYYFSDVPKWRLRFRDWVSKERFVPNYVMTGPGKSGSSDLVSHLLAHPNVYPPLVKEPKLHWKKYWRACYPTVKEVQKRAEQVGGPIRCGYLDPKLHSIFVMETLYEHNPDCKIIITLRDPVDRAYSFWKWELLRGGKGLHKHKRYQHFNSFADYADRAMDLFPSIPVESINGLPVLEEGIYYKAVELWRKRFGNKNVLVLDVADYFRQRQPTLERIQEFLEIPIIDIPEYDKKVNENPIKRPPADAQTKAALAEFYRPYNQKLFDLLETEFDWQ